MQFAAVYESFTTSGAGLRASCAELGAWTRLAVAAAKRESDTLPVLQTDRESIHAYGLLLSEIELAVSAGLAERLDDGTIRIAGFDHEGLQRYNARRENGRRNGPKGAEHGPKGAEYGHLGAEYGHLGGRPRKEVQPAAVDPDVAVKRLVARQAAVRVASELPGMFGPDPAAVERDLVARKGSAEDLRTFLRQQGISL